MSATATRAGFDFATLKRALEQNDAGTLIRLYAADAEMTVVDRTRPPSAPMRLVGRPAIEEFWRDVCARDMTHAVGNEVVGAGRLSFMQRCAYPDGCQVMSAQTLELGKDGRIARHLTVQAWDEVSCSTASA
jgi:SnoaL-like domain